MRWLLSLLMLALAGPLAARVLPVPADKGWKHAATGVVLTAQLVGLPRTALTDETASEHDIVAQFESPDKSLLATVYIFRPAIADAALWFDRSRTALESSDAFRGITPATAAPVGFAAGRAREASSLRQVYGRPEGRYRSTALAIVPFGEWVIGIRMSATTLVADQLDVRLLELIDAIRWPDVPAAAAAKAVPIKACAAPLAFRKAKLVKPSGADLLVSLLGNVAAQQPSDEASAAPTALVWCRDGEPSTEFGVYRSDNSTTAYVLALSDAGRVVRVFPSLIGQVRGSRTYSVTLEDVDGTVSTFASFTALPMPRQVWDLVASGARTGTSKGNQIVIDPASMK